MSAAASSYGEAFPVISVVMTRPSGTQFAVEISPLATIRELIMKIHETLELGVMEQATLLMNCEALDRLDSKLSEWGIQANCKITVVVHRVQQVVTASSDKTAKVWNVTSGECTQTLAGHTDTVTWAAFSP